MGKEAESTMNAIEAIDHPPAPGKCSVKRRANAAHDEVRPLVSIILRRNGMEEWEVRNRDVEL